MSLSKLVGITALRRISPEPWVACKHYKPLCKQRLGHHLSTFWWETNLIDFVIDLVLIFHDFGTHADVILMFLDVMLELFSNLNSTLFFHRCSWLLTSSIHQLPRFYCRPIATVTVSQQVVQEHCFTFFRHWFSHWLFISSLFLDPRNQYQINKFAPCRASKGSQKSSDVDMFPHWLIFVIVWHPAPPILAVLGSMLASFRFVWAAIVHGVGKRTAHH